MRQLTHRERRLLVTCASLSAAWLLGALVIWPALQSRTESMARIEKADAIAALLARSPDQRRAPAELQQPLPTLLTRQAERANVTIRRLDPADGMISATLDDAPFTAVVGWMAALTEEHGLRVALVEMGRLTAPGMVSTRVILEAGP